MDDKLMNLGFTDRFVQEASFYEGLFLGRVVTQSKDLYKVATGNSVVIAEMAGRLRHYAENLMDYPAVGDFVMVDREDDLHGNAIIQAILGRKSVFFRRAAGTSNETQAVAANIDTVFICMSLNKDYNLRRLERYLSIGWNSGATPVVVLTKSDLCDDIEKILAEINKIAMGADVLITSSMREDGYISLLNYILPGKTVAFIGSSGVGKSTLVNRLLGEEKMETLNIGKDDKGRHATTRRELILLPTGGAVIDTPGMREIGVEKVDTGKAFAEIEELALHCRFKDCRHEREPGCAVRKAIGEGSIDVERLLSYNKLEKEAKYQGLNSKQIEKEKIEEMFSGFGGMKNAREFIKSKNKSRGND